MRATPAKVSNDLQSYANQMVITCEDFSRGRFLELAAGGANDGSATTYGDLQR